MRVISYLHLVAVFAAIAFSGPWGTAQVLVVESGSKGPQPTPPAARFTEPRVMLVSPADEPIPALKYRFAVAPSERRPGNAMVVVQRALLMYHEARTPDSDREYVERSAVWNQADLEDLPREEIRKYLERFRNVLDELAQLPYLERVEYELRFQEMTGPRLVTVLLPELNQARSLARLLQLEIRLALAEGRHDDALRTLQTGFRLAEVTTAATPTIIGKLVGFAIAGMMLGEVQTAITVADAPNYYWSLASLNDAQWEIQDAIEFEGNALMRVMSSLAALPEERIDNVAWRNRLLVALDEFYQMAQSQAAGQRGDPPTANSGIRLAAGFIVLGADGLARRYLETMGVNTTDMSPPEAILRATRHDLARVRDEQLKWALLPDRVGRFDIRSISQELADPLVYHEGLPSPFPATRPLAWLMQPAFQSFQQAAVRGRQTVAVLATVEALRMHAARHGRFPESLETLDAVPAWPDPFTGMLFPFECRSPTEVVIKRDPSIQNWLPPILILRLRGE